MVAPGKTLLTLVACRKVAAVADRAAAGSTAAAGTAAALVAVPQGFVVTAEVVAVKEATAIAIVIVGTEIEVAIVDVIGPAAGTGIGVDKFNSLALTFGD